MIQQLVVYAIVAAAAGWASWSLFLKGWFRRRAAAANAAKDCGSDCACGD